MKYQNFDRLRSQVLAGGAKVVLLVLLTQLALACSLFGNNGSNPSNRDSANSPVNNSSKANPNSSSANNAGNSNGDSKSSDRTAERYTYEQNGLSFVPPQNWKPKEVPGISYKAFVGDTVDNFTPSINLVDEAYTGSVTDYVDVNLRSVEKAFKNFQKISQSEFKTESGETGLEVVTESDQLGDRLRQTFYVFNGPSDRKIVITCSSLAKDGNKLATVFANSMKTVRIKK